MPSFDFSRSMPRWAPHAGEFAHSLNAISFVTPHLERFLNRVMARARAEITGTDPESARVRADISTFIKQESCHYTIHGGFNNILRQGGYDQLPEIEKTIVAHYDKLLATKSLKFLVGYCEGFESLLPPTAERWFDGTIDRFMEDAEPNAANMWRWHIMEEFEHRTVCHDGFKALNGRYALRVYTFFYQMFWLRKLTGLVKRHLIDVDRASMSAREIEQSQSMERQVDKAMNDPVIRAMPKILSPGYSPRDMAEPAGWSKARDMIERDWMKGATAPA